MTDRWLVVKVEQVETQRPDGSPAGQADVLQFLGRKEDGSPAWYDSIEAAEIEDFESRYLATTAARTVPKEEGASVVSYARALDMVEADTWQRLEPSGIGLT